MHIVPVLVSPRRKTLHLEISRSLHVVSCGFWSLRNTPHEAHRPLANARPLGESCPKNCPALGLTIYAGPQGHCGDEQGWASEPFSPAAYISLRDSRDNLAH